MNLGGTESSPITELRWCSLEGGSFSSSLKWALVILLRAFWKDPFWRSMEDTKGSRPVSFSVKNLNSFLSLCWKERPLSQGSISPLVCLESCYCNLADENQQTLVWGLQTNRKHGVQVLVTGFPSSHSELVIPTSQYLKSLTLKLESEENILQGTPKRATCRPSLLVTDYMHRDGKTGRSCHLTSIFLPLVLKYNEGLKTRTQKSFYMICIL